MLAVLAPWLAGCGTTIRPPPAPAEPARIAVLDHGRHTSLLVEDGPAGMVRWAYGDWEWYALGRTGPAQGSRALLGPSPAALGRRRLAGPLGPEAVAREVGVPVEQAFYLEVEESRLERLKARLDAIFDRAAGPLESARFDLAFVPHPVPYSLAHNSNRVVAAWLEELGCEVEGAAVLASWRLGGAVAAAP
ncbi:hypothetical protein SH611_18210 [Geminicoccaceae bacterium 1502E]|nr:hypothetical protein [Geminicoccaceae bacterium 1502E]